MIIRAWEFDDGELDRALAQIARERDALMSAALKLAEERDRRRALARAVDDAVTPAAGRVEWPMGLDEGE
ncbi:MAG: hypothetical protein GEV10_13780 [Streptosporangiales bacterium]|nr:hypothetical protein [Streptosporangiales bacterium]